MFLDYSSVIVMVVLLESCVNEDQSLLEAFLLASDAVLLSCQLHLGANAEAVVLADGCRSELQVKKG